MSDIKLTSDEVPEKFAEWLLAMGCPPEKVPSVDKITQMCRGSYYLVWRSLMEQVEAKDIIRQKRLQVFADDVRRCKKKHLFTEHDTNALIPPELTLWRQQAQLRQKVAEAEARVAEARRNLNDIMDKVSSKLAQRNAAQQRAQHVQRRAWLLQLLAEDLRAKKRNMLEAKTIAEEMCCVHDSGDVQPKLDRYLASLRRPHGPAVASSTMIGNSTASCSVVSNNGDIEEEQITQLVQCRGDALWSELYTRRAALVSSLSTKAETTPEKNRPSYQSVLAHTASLQCTLALEALKCRDLARITQARLVANIDQLNSELNSETCELLVLQCERARGAARVSALQHLLEEITAGRGLFERAECTDRNTTRRIMDIDKSIESKRDDLKNVISNLAVTERKTQNARDCLVAIFNGFRKDTTVNSNRGINLEVSTDSIPALRQFYETRKERRRNKMQLSMDFESSDNSFNDNIDSNNTRYIDELKIYFKKFVLEKNRKLVLESGEKIWIFETLQSSLQRMYGKCDSSDVVPAVCPSVCVSRAAAAWLKAVEHRNRLKTLPLRDVDLNIVFDIDKRREEEVGTVDKIKKRLNENIRSLQKTSKHLDMGQDNLKLWAENDIKTHISNRRTIDGKPYKAYENYYKEVINF